MQKNRSAHRFRQSRNIWAIACSCLLTAFTVFVLLDTFVIGRVQQTVQEADYSSIVAAQGSSASVQEVSNTSAQADSSSAASSSAASSSAASSSAQATSASGSSSSSHASSSSGTSSHGGKHEGRHGSSSGSPSGGSSGSSSSATTDVSQVIPGTASAASAGTSVGSYSDGNIQIEVYSLRAYDTDIYVADVQVSSAQYLKTALAQNAFGRNLKDTTSNMADAAGAVLAINGDYFIGHNNVGFVARQGKVYRTKCDNPEEKSKTRLDVLIIDDQGDLHILPQATNADIESFQGNIVNGFSFGPGLVIDGVRQGNYVNQNNGSDVKAMRMCIAQTGPLEYLCIASEGPEDPGSVGMDLEQFTDLVASFEGVQNAYNLDGGISSTMSFKRGGKYVRVNSPDNPKSRQLKDILFFSSAYIP